jgi:uracil-DNA glycosylase
VLEAEHPSPLATYRGFFGSRPFSQVNAFFQSKGINDPIDWRLA